MSNFSFRTILPQAFLTVLCLAGAALPLQADANVRDDAYALVRDGQRTTFVGSMDSGERALASLKKQFAGNFIWYRQSGKAWIVRDPSTLAEVAAAWAPVDRLSQDMNAFDARMRVHSDAMALLSGDMTASARGANGQPRATEAIGKRMEELGKTMDALGKQMEALGKQIERDSKRADASSRALLQAAVTSGAAQAVAAGAR